MFLPYALADRDLDVALLPYWYFLDDAGRALVAEHLPARRVIACHVPSGEEDDVKTQLRELTTGVFVPGRVFESLKLSAE